MNADVRPQIRASDSDRAARKDRRRSRHWNGPMQKMMIGETNTFHVDDRIWQIMSSKDNVKEPAKRMCCSGDMIGETVHVEQLNELSRIRVVEADVDVACDDDWFIERCDAIHDIRHIVKKTPRRQRPILDDK